MKTFLTLLLLSAVSSFGAIIQNPMTTNRAAAYPSSGQAGVFNGTQWVFVSTNAFGGIGTASNAIANFTGLGTNTQFYATGTSNIVLDVIAQSLNTGTSSVTSVDWQSRILFGTDGLTGISWGTGALVGNGSGLTNIPGSALQSPLNVSSMNVGTLTATNTFLTNGYYFHTNATTGQWGYWDTNGVHFESNFLSGVWWWRGPTNSMSGLTGTTNYQLDGLTGNQTNTGVIKATTFYGVPASLTNSIGVSIDGGGASITTGQKGYIMAPINSTIVGWSLASTSVGSCVVDVWKCAHTAYPPTVANSIGGSALPTLATTNWFYTNSLAGWSTSVTNGDWFGWNVNSATTISNLTLQIYTVPR